MKVPQEAVRWRSQGAVTWPHSPRGILHELPRSAAYARARQRGQRRLWVAWQEALPLLAWNIQQCSVWAPFLRSVLGDRARPHVHGRCGQRRNAARTCKNRRSASHECSTDTRPADREVTHCPALRCLSVPPLSLATAADFTARVALQIAQPNWHSV